MREIEVLAFGDVYTRVGEKDGEHVCVSHGSTDCRFLFLLIQQDSFSSLKVPLRVSLSVFLSVWFVWISGPSNTSRKAERTKPTGRLLISLQWVMRLGMSLSFWLQCLIVLQRLSLLQAMMGDKKDEDARLFFRMTYQKMPKYRGVIKLRPKSKPVCLEFFHFFILLFIQGFFLFLFLFFKEDEKRSPLKFLRTGQLNHPLKHIYNQHTHRHILAAAYIYL